MSEHEVHMRAALGEARKAHGLCHPNPAVGALILHEGDIVARGHTQAPGGHHAEVGAIEEFVRGGFSANSSTTLYVTMEPCCTYGRTPPCTAHIIQSGIPRVVVGATDPNPRHAGEGYDHLREAGVVVEVGVCHAECEDLNLVFHHWMRHHTPLFAGKIATTLDGRIATRTGHSQWITSEAARQDVARWRRAFPAIAVGGGTVVRDDPRLTARLAGTAIWSPRRLIFDRAGQCLAAPERRVFADAFAHRTVYITADDHVDVVPNIWRERGVEVWPLHDWSETRWRCLEAELTGVYIEGGTRLLGDLLHHRQLDYLFAYRAPKWLGDERAPGPFEGFAPEHMESAFQLTDVHLDSFGEDQLMRGNIVYPKDVS